MVADLSRVATRGPEALALRAPHFRSPPQQSISSELETALATQPCLRLSD